MGAIRRSQPFYVCQMPAFATPSGIPYPYINLKQGQLRHDRHDQCTAGATTLTLEFGTLTKLTGNKNYWEKASISHSMLRPLFKQQQNARGEHIHILTLSYSLIFPLFAFEKQVCASINGLFSLGHDITPGVARNPRRMEQAQRYRLGGKHTNFHERE